MKDKTIEIPIKEFVGLKSKIYSLVKDNTGEHKES